jgi:hypothetical protein
MNWKEFWKEAVVAYSRYYSSILTGDPMTSMNDLSQDNRCPLRDSKQTPQKYKSRTFNNTGAIANIYGNKMVCMVVISK